MWTRCSIVLSGAGVIHDSFCREIWRCIARHIICTCHMDGSFVRREERCCCRESKNSRSCNPGL